jgi:HAD hydrolase, family IA, variant 3
MTQHKFKLIIWDFDGVIADTEHLWVKNRQKMLNEKFNLDWDFATANKYLGGMSDKTKRLNLDKLGIKTDDKFWEDALAADYETMRKGFCLTKGIEKIFNDKNFKQCIATGGIRSKTAEKIKTVKIGSLFPDEKIFTADMVEHGKPEPDLFWLAAKTMGEQQENCVVIEDSLPGMTAALRAGMTAVAYIGCEMNNNPEYVEKIKKLGVKYIFDNMDELYAWLKS